MRALGATALRGWTALAVRMLVLAICVGMAGCAKKRRAGAVTCDLPKGMLAKLSATKSVFDLEPKMKGRWMKAIRNDCKPWPGYALKAMDVAIPLDPDQPVGLSRTPLWARAGYRKAEKQICPGFAEVRGLPLGGDKRKRMTRTYWDRCGLAKLGLMDYDEFDHNGTFAICAIAMHRMLVTGGLNTAVARKMVRLFLLDEPHLRRVKAARVQLPTSRSTTVMADAMDIAINQSAVLLRGRVVAKVKGWVVDANSKRDGPDGFFIDPLYKRTRDEAKKLKAAEKQGAKPYRGDALVTVDGRARYRLLAEVLYTAKAAGFKKFQLSVRDTQGKPHVVVIHQTRLSRIRANAPKPRFQPPELWIAGQEYVLRFGATGTPTRWSKAQGRAAALKKLTAFLRARLAKIKHVKLPRWARGRILVNTDHQTGVGELIQVLDAIRERKDGSAGCTLRYNRKDGSWSVPLRARKACLYPWPILKLGGSDPPPAVPNPK